MQTGELSFQNAKFRHAVAVASPQETLTVSKYTKTATKKKVGLACVLRPYEISFRGFLHPISVRGEWLVLLEMYIAARYQLSSPATHSSDRLVTSLLEYEALQASRHNVAAGDRVA